jgi:hypothetical protein
MAPKKANFVRRCMLLNASVTFIYYCMLYLTRFLFSVRNVLFLMFLELPRLNKIVTLNCIGRAAVPNAAGVRNCLLLCSFFWAIPRRLSFMCRRFGTLCLFHPNIGGVDLTYEDGTECPETSAHKI